MNSGRQLLFLSMWVFIVIVSNVYIDKIDDNKMEISKLGLYAYPESEQKTWKVTAYCACEICCGRWADGMTASGYEIEVGAKFCATELPFNTVLDIPGYGLAPVLDRGPVGNHIDVYFDKHEQAKVWGVKYLKIGVLK